MFIRTEQIVCWRYLKHKRFISDMIKAVDN